jgi:c(7)-type cytochrome triheme protein
MEAGASELNMSGYLPAGAGNGLMAVRHLSNVSENSAPSYVRCRTEYPDVGGSNTCEQDRTGDCRMTRGAIHCQPQRSGKMKLVKILAVLAALSLSIGNVMAVPSGKTIEFASPNGKVVFDGKEHAEKGIKCADCHSKPKLFEMKKSGDKITMAAMNEGKFCGACHDGKKAFGVKAPADCVKCHQKSGAGDKSDANKPAKEKSTASSSKSESPGEYVDDAVITAKVKAAVLEEPSLKSAEINVETLKGTVQLAGFVRSRADINKAVEVAKRVKGVKSVKNDMVLKGTQ